MSESFSPLLPHRNAAQSTGQPSPASNVKAPFIPLGATERSAQTPSDTSDTSDQPAVPHASPAATSVAPTPPAPAVTLKREGERVVQIQIRCTCGELMHLDCQY